MAVTSGTVSTTVFKTQKMMDIAFRRCKMLPQQITPEHMQVALDSLYLLLSDMANRGIPLWCIEQDILPIYQGNISVDCPLGTVDVLSLNLRTSQRLSGSYSSSAGTAANAFDGDLTTACTQVAPGGNILFTGSSTFNFSMVGLLPNTSGTWSFTIATSTDGVTYNTIYTATNLVVVDGQWIWLDFTDSTSVVGSSYLNSVQYVKLTGVGTILDVTEFVISNAPKEIPMAKINQDDYGNLPDKTFQGRPVQYWFDRQQAFPIIRIWPAPSLEFTFSTLILSRHRHIQDVGLLTNILEIPQRWVNALIWDLAMTLATEIKEVDPVVLMTITPIATQVITRAWNSESDGAPVYWVPNISAYTR